MLDIPSNMVFKWTLPKICRRRRLTFLLFIIGIGIVGYSLLVRPLFASQHRVRDVYLKQSSILESLSANLFAFGNLATATVNAGIPMESPQRTKYAATPLIAPHGHPIIFIATKFYTHLHPDVSRCPVYNNCQVIYGYSKSQPQGMPEFREASVVLWQKSFLRNRYLLPHNLPWEIRTKQLWILKDLESPPFFKTRYPGWIEGHFNISISYRRGSDIRSTYQPFKLRKRENPLPGINYKEGKTRGALAIVSNCFTSQYNRMYTLRTIGKYIDLDIFGSCGSKDPCGRMKFQCEAKTYKQYHFYMAFENSLCKDYVTEKFWERLRSGAHFVPVVMGGTDQSDYNDAPPNSLINIYDFDSSQALGIYLKRLMNDTEDYNSYHKWRESYYFDTNEPANMIPACEICKLANTLPRKLPRTDLVNWWNTACYDFNPND